MYFKKRETDMTIRQVSKDAVRMTKVRFCNCGKNQAKLMAKGEEIVKK